MGFNRRRGGGHFFFCLRSCATCDDYSCHCFGFSLLRDIDVCIVHYIYMQQYLCIGVCSHRIGEILWKIKNVVERAVLFCVC